MTVPASPSPDALVPADTGRVDIMRIFVIVTASIAVPLVVIAVLVLPPVVGVLVGVVLAIGVVWFVSRGIDDRVMSRSGSRPLAADEAPRLANLVDGAAGIVGITAPDIAVIDIDERDAGVLGWRGPGVLVVTRGLLDGLGRVELEGVVARELVALRSGLQARRTVAAGLVGWLSPGLARPLAGGPASLDDDVSVDLAAVGLTRYPPGLALGLRACQDGPSRRRSDDGVTWMVGDAPDASPRLGVRIAALDEL